MRRLIALTLVFLVAGAAHSMVTAELALDKVKANFAGVKDYSVRAMMSVDSPTLHVSESRFKVYYKKPDKLHIRPEGGFAMVPQGMLLGNPFEQISHNNNLYLVGEKNLNGQACWLIKITPKEKAPNKIESVLWVEKARGLILKSVAEPAMDAKIQVNWDYVKIDGKYWLPSKIEVMIDGLPAEITRERGPFVKSSGKASGKATIEFNDYKVNKGISDSVFRRNEEK